MLMDDVGVTSRQQRKSSSCADDIYRLPEAI